MSSSSNSVSRETSAPEAATLPGNDLFATPLQIDDPGDCFFYHFMDLPGNVSVGETWDLRDHVDEYLGHLDYNGKRALDVGAASGFLSFEMEKRGAQVVSFDMASVENWNFVPHYRLNRHLPTIFKQRRDVHEKMINAYWYTHAQLGSNNQVHYGDVYQLPQALGQFDIVFMGTILPHLRDPFQAIYSASRLAENYMVITNPGRIHRIRDWLKGKRRFEAKFLPSETNETCDVWWALSISCIERMLETIGFNVVERVQLKAPCHTNQRVKKRSIVSLVAKRIWHLDDPAWSTAPG